LPELNDERSYCDPEPFGRQTCAKRKKSAHIPLDSCRGALIGLWQWYGSRQDVFAIAPFSDVVSSFVQGFISGKYLVALGGTLATVALGYVIAATIGIAVGLWIGISAFARHVVEPLTNALYATPVSL